VVKPSEALLDYLRTSSEYGEYIFNNCHGERAIGNGDALICAMEEGYLWEAFLASKGIDEDELN
jgi:hypothetical protein